MQRHYLRARPAGPESTGHWHTGQCAPAHWHAATAPPHRGEPTDTAHIRTHSTTRTDSHSGRRRSTLARRSALGSSGWGVVVGPVGTRPNHTLLSLCTQVCTWTLVRAGGADEPPSPYHLHIGTLVIGCRFHVSMTSHSFGPVPRVIAKRGGGCSACQGPGCHERVQERRHALNLLPTDDSVGRVRLTASNEEDAPAAEALHRAASRQGEEEQGGRGRAGEGEGCGEGSHIL
jgi:hypothetical protein